MAIGETLRYRTTSLSAWKLPKEDSCIAPDNVWSNKGERRGAARGEATATYVLTLPDMDPTPPEDRRWTSWTFITYWGA